MRTRLTSIVLALVVGLMGCSSEEPIAGPPGTSAPSATSASLRVVSINLLHGTACPDDSDRCDLPGRVALFADQLAAADCPEVVSVQEANQRTVDELRNALSICEYEIVWDDDPSLDREAVLSTLPVVGHRRFRLAGPLRSAYWVRVQAEVGLVDYFSTHLASSSDDRPCDATTCPPPCAVADSVNTCQMRQVVAHAEEFADDNAVVVIGGDLNATPTEPTIASLRDAGYVDTHLAAGNAECDPVTGDQCTSGRVDDAMADLIDPTSRQRERIDYLFVSDARGCDVVDASGLFNGAPSDGPLAHPSDHTGVIATLVCSVSAEQRTAASAATMPPLPSTTIAVGGGPPDEPTRQAISDAFNTLFAGSVSDPEVKLTALEDAELLRESFFAMYERTKAIAERIEVRLDAITLTDASHAEVTYTLLLDGAAVLDRLPGKAIQIDGRWLVSRRTYCDVATQGATEIPDACRA